MSRGRSHGGRLPNGVEVFTDKEYIEGWRIPGHRLEAFMGGTLYAFDPDFAFHTGHTVTDIPAKLGLKIVALLDLVEELERKGV